MASAMTVALVALSIFATFCGASTPIQTSNKVSLLTEKAVLRSYREPSGAKLNHLAVDKFTDRIFIGGVNRLLELTSEFVQMANAKTGPIFDSHNCSIYYCPPKAADRKQTNNVNKALAIDYSASRLIECGSVYQGMCSVRSLHNVSNVRLIHQMVVANDATSSTVAFVAPGPSIVENKDVLYVATTYTGNSEFRSWVPAVSSRSLDDSSPFQFAHSADTTGTRIFFNPLSRERYLINYVYGFSSEGFSYFLTTQRENLNQFTKYFSKLVRICQDDEDYYSYTEIPIKCTGKGDENNDYNLVQAAFVGKAGSTLATELGITTQDDVLYAVFSKSESNYTSRAADPSALCVYSLKHIRHKFLQNIKTCFNGKGNRGLSFISPSHACVSTPLDKINEDFCGLDINTPLGGNIPAKAEAVLLFDTQLTAVAATSIGNSTVVFIGTVKGHLKKVVIESRTSAFEHGDIVVDKDSPVNKNLLFDARSLHLYAMTAKKVFKVKVQDCTEYTNCNPCLDTKDSYCEWCSIENKCASQLSKARERLQKEWFF